jgi:hypothetical protein
MQAFLGDIQAFVEKNKNHPVLAGAVNEPARAHEAVGTRAMQFLGWFQGGEIEKVPLNSNRFLQMMSELTVGWLLLDAAVIALEAQKKLDKAHPDWAFYEGKKAAAKFWASTVLAAVPTLGDILRAADKSPLEIPNEGFATV